MKYNNLKKVSDREIKKWIIENFPEISSYQKDWLKKSNFVEGSPYEFFENETKKVGFWIRFTMPLFFIVYLVLMLFLPINFLIKGRWNYGNLKFMQNWQSKLKI